MADAPTIFRYLRVIEYVGTRERLQESIERRAVKGTTHFGPGLTIYEGIVGEGVQPMTGQVKLWACKQIVAADEGKLPFECDAARNGYLNAINDLLVLLEPPSKEPSNG